MSANLLDNVFTDLLFSQNPDERNGKMSDGFANATAGTRLSQPVTISDQDMLNHVVAPEEVNVDQIPSYRKSEERTARVTQKSITHGLQCGSAAHAVNIFNLKIMEAGASQCAIDGGDSRISTLIWESDQRD